jgi:hypothetical protein
VQSASSQSDPQAVAKATPKADSAEKGSQAKSKSLQGIPEEEEDCVEFVPDTQAVEGDGVGYTSNKRGALSPPGTTPSKKVNTRMYS